MRNNRKWRLQLVGRSNEAIEMIWRLYNKSLTFGISSVSRITPVQSVSALLVEDQRWQNDIVVI